MRRRGSSRRGSVIDTLHIARISQLNKILRVRVCVYVRACVCMVYVCVWCVCVMVFMGICTIVCAYECM